MSELDRVTFDYHEMTEEQARVALRSVLRSFSAVTVLHFLADEIKRVERDIIGYGNVQAWRYSLSKWRRERKAFEHAANELYQWHHTH